MKIFVAGHRGLVGSTITKLLQNSTDEIVFRTSKELDLTNVKEANDNVEFGQVAACAGGACATE
jgi:dTDP-4-dehydrorhamnose reductase